MSGKDFCCTEWRGTVVVVLFLVLFILDLSQLISYVMAGKNFLCISTDPGSCQDGRCWYFTDSWSEGGKLYFNMHWKGRTAGRTEVGAKTLTGSSNCATSVYLAESVRLMLHLKCIPTRPRAACLNAFYFFWGLLYLGLGVRVVGAVTVAGTSFSERRVQKALPHNKWTICQLKRAKARKDVGASGTPIQPPSSPPMRL